MVPVPLVVELDDDVEDCGVYSVDGTVSGTPHRFVLDTGSPSTQIADPDARISGFAVEEDMSEGLFGRVPVERVVLPDLTVPGLTSGRRTVARLRAGGAGARSLLGLDVLGEHGPASTGPPPLSTRRRPEPWLPTCRSSAATAGTAPCR